jgi:TDG/mug DNA glycosylase family protein
MSGFTPSRLSPFDEEELLNYGYGIVNIVNYATARADELTREELVRGGIVLEEKLRSFKPRFSAIMGLEAYRSAFGWPKALPGPQPEKLAGISETWVLPNPSGLNAAYQIGALVEMMKELKAAVDRECGA